MKVRSEVLRSAREWFDNHGWYETSPPIINKSACEGGSTLFEMKYFDDKAYLSQSAQLYLEAIIYSVENAWSLTPSFRAEKSKTPRHLAEYWHLEGEQAWARFDDILAVEENLISYIANNVADRKSKELEALGRNPYDLQKVVPPFERIPYAEVINILQHKGKDIKFGDDLGADDERDLTQDFEKPIFIYGCPTVIKPFYTKINPKDETMVLSADMIAPKGFGEISTGGQREENLDVLINRIIKDGFDPKDYSWYLDTRKYGSVPHSGFGFGVERLIRWMCNLEHIRDTIPFPRTMVRSYP
jgi:asparaginyl-tRNA synthetase